ncbi:MAG: nucleotidyltransferase family protein [Parvibaculum sp.]|uniref:nucleotidyltransferase family protein n=1 Tax=Parvibaculum sp. TaxID=2024848 RepID=UPI003C742DA5
MDEAAFLDLALRNPVNREIAARLPALDLPDAWLVSGSLFQSVWNGLTGRDVLHGIKDYDVFYFDPDTSWEAEDKIIRQCAALLADLGAPVEVRNQARVHLWYPQKFGSAYPPLSSATEGIDRFLAPASMVGLSLSGAARRVYAPHGLADVGAMIVRPSGVPNFSAERYAEKAARWKASWPEVTVIPA